jgi:hypothetical protein
MTADQIIRLGIEMRAAQKAYFRDRSRAELLRSKELERRFDQEARAHFEVDDPLFAGGGKS